VRGRGKSASPEDQRSLPTRARRPLKREADRTEVRTSVEAVEPASSVVNRNFAAPPAGSRGRDPTRLPAALPAARPATARPPPAGSPGGAAGEPWFPGTSTPLQPTALVRARAPPALCSNSSRRQATQSPHKIQSSPLHPHPSRGKVYVRMHPTPHPCRARTPLHRTPNPHALASPDLSSHPLPHSTTDGEHQRNHLHTAPHHRPTP
jgi:hypothetical protein